MRFIQKLSFFKRHKPACQLQGPANIPERGFYKLKIKKMLFEIHKHKAHFFV